jgi:hypothetical protein
MLRRILGNLSALVAKIAPAQKDGVRGGKIPSAALDRLVAATEYSSFAKCRIIKGVLIQRASPSRGLNNLKNFPPHFPFVSL